MKNLKKLLPVFAAVLLIAALAISASAKDNTTVKAPKFTTAPVIDGVISTAEWGEPTAYAKVFVGRNDYKYDDEDNVMTSDFCFMDPSRVMYPNDITFDIWLRWDEQFFYIGVVSKDKYGLSTGMHVEEGHPKYYDLWDGDALQFAIDAAGANSNGNPSNPFGDMTSGMFFILGCMDSTGAETVLMNEVNYDEAIGKGAIKWNGGVWPTFTGEPNTEAGYLTYEVAVPYASFGGKIEEGKTTGFGVTVARVSGTPGDAVDEDGNVIGQDWYENWLSWGDGVMGSTKDQLPEYRCGANSVILVDTPATGAGAEQSPSAPAASETEEAPADETAEEPAEGEDAAETSEDGEEVTEAPEDEEETVAEDPEKTETEEEPSGDEAETADGSAEDEPADDVKKDSGSEESADEETGNAGEVKEEGNTLVGAIIGVIAAVVVIAAVIIIVLFKKKK